MIYTIDWCEVKKSGNTNGRGWSITEMTLVDPTGVKIDKVSTFDSVNPGMSIEGDIVKNDKGYLNFVAKKAVANSNFKSDQIKKTAIEIQQNISENVAKAQDRSAWMWAKTNASTLIGDSMSSANNDTIARRILDLATQIYNGEPLVPFN